MCTKLLQSRPCLTPTLLPLFSFSVIFSFFAHLKVLLLDLSLPYVLFDTYVLLAFAFLPEFTFLAFSQLPCYFLLLVSFALTTFFINFCCFSSHCLFSTRLHRCLPLSSLSIPLTPLFSSLNFVPFLCQSVMYFLMPLRPASLCQISLV